MPNEHQNSGNNSEELDSQFNEAAENTFLDAKNELAHRHMIALSELFDSWVLDERFRPAQVANLLGWAERLRQLAIEVGSAWDPPAPKERSLMRDLAQIVLGETM